MNPCIQASYRGLWVTGCHPRQVGVVKGMEGSRLMAAKKRQLSLTRNSNESAQAI